MIPVDEGLIEKRTAIVADDHGVFRMALSAILRRDCGFHEVLEAGSVDEAVQQLGEHGEVTFATFDLGMPGIDTVDNLHSIKEVFPKLRIAIVSASERREDMIAAMEAGVHGYIPKTLSPQDIAAALNAILRGTIFLPWSVSNVPLTNPGELDTTEPGNPAAARLTARQTEVLRLIREGKSNKEIARVLGLTENTVKVHTNALYRALGVRNRVGAASVRLE